MQQPKERKIKNVLIRNLTNEDRRVITALMAETECRQASKALIKTAYSFFRILGVVKRQQEKIQALEEENKLLRASFDLMTDAHRAIGRILLTNNPFNK